LFKQKEYLLDASESCQSTIRGTNSDRHHFPTISELRAAKPITAKFSLLTVEFREHQLSHMANASLDEPEVKE
jgi:hypothetical protein